MNRLGLAFAIACLAASASAQTVYRCGSAYTQVPCAAGKLIDVNDPVTAEQRAEAREAARREERLGDTMARERRAEAAALRPARAANIGPLAKKLAKAPPPKQKTRARKKAWAPDVDGDFVARVPKKLPPS